MRNVFLAATAAVTVLASGSTPSLAQEVMVQITIRDHRFQPERPKAPAGRPISLQITNADPTPEEFESKTLRVERVIPGGARAVIRLRPLQPGAYKFFGEFHESTAQGALIVE